MKGKMKWSVFVAAALGAMGLFSCQPTTSTQRGEGQQAASVSDSVVVEAASGEVVETTYFPAIERYLADTVGAAYAPAPYSIPSYTIVRVDERKSDDILVWGDFWVFNYKLCGDTLVTVSGGNHPGLLHIRQTDTGFEVTGFDQVADGAGNTESAKEIFGKKYDVFRDLNGDEKKREQRRALLIARYAAQHHLAASCYQDYGWPAVALPKWEE